MSDPSIHLLASLFPVALLLVLAYVIRARGSQGFVHGIGDWSKSSEQTRRRAGRATSNVLFEMAALILGHGIYARIYPNDRASAALANLVLSGGISLLMIGLLLYLLHLQKIDSAGRHGRR